MILAHNVAELERRIARIERLFDSEKGPPVKEVQEELRTVMMNVAGSLCTLQIVRGPYDDEDGEKVVDLKGRTGILEAIPLDSVMEVNCG
jgi:succinate dehydrogenase/fumarate reductase flavoprotein subunit